jgi:hypothetical protein
MGALLGNPVDETWQRKRDVIMPLQDNSNAENVGLERILRTPPEYFSFAELAQRWRCSRATVYNRLRGVGAEVLDFALPGKKGKKIIAVATVLQIEDRRTRRLR